MLSTGMPLGRSLLAWVVRLRSGGANKIALGGGRRPAAWKLVGSRR